MRVRIILAIAALILAITGCTIAQDWGPMQEIYWANPPRFNLPGIFNPSFCDSDSTLYFDDFLRFFFAYGVIYSSRLLGKNEYGQLEWTDPESLPAPINIPGYLNACPCITVGGDSLFFCSNRPGTRGGMDIWLSVKEDTLWAEPINLGDSINSSTDELKPYYISDTRTLYFDRLENIHTYLFDIYSNSLDDNNAWQSAYRLPAIINRPDTGSYGAFYNQYDNNLYFTSTNASDNSNLAIFSALYADGIWQQPQALTENINGFWFPNDCHSHGTGDGWITADRRLIFFDKEIWEPSCIDFTSWLFYSENSSSITENYEISNAGDYVKVYPNPSNSSFAISISGSYEEGTLSIYNLNGQLVYKSTIDSHTPTIIWNTSNNEYPISSGVYFARFESSGNAITKRLVLIK